MQHAVLSMNNVLRRTSLLSLIILVVGTMALVSGTPAAALSTTPRAAQTHHASASMAHIGSGKGKGMSNPPTLSPRERAKRERMLQTMSATLPSTPIDPTKSIRPSHVSPTQLQVRSAKSVPYAPVSTTVNDLGSQNADTINEPSVGSDGSKVLETWNWYSGISTNGGSTWTYYDPKTLFSNDYGGWCCDSHAIYVPSRNIFIWILLYPPDTNGGALRLVVFDGGADLAATTYHYWDLTPQQAGAGTGDWYDFPAIGFSNNDFYLQANKAHSGQKVTYQTTYMRFSLDDLVKLAGQTLPYGYLDLPGVSTVAFSQGATGTMYFAGHLSTSTLRVFHIDEGSNTVFWDDVNHVSYPSGGYSCPRTGAADSNWCARSDDRLLGGWVSNGVIGFSWNAPQGQWGFQGSAPYPYTDIVRINEISKTEIDDPVVWNQNYAYMYMSHYPNSNGDLGGTFMYGGGSLYESGGAYIWDGSGRDFVGLVSSTQDTTNGGDFLAARSLGASWVGTMYAVLNDGTHTYDVTFGR